MCGLYGFTTKKEVKLTAEQATIRNRILNGLCVAMETRGSHSTGIATFENKWKIYKKAIRAFEFIQEKKYQDILNQNTQSVIGHTRFATIGEKTDNNAHPFKIGNIIGVHNGHISNYDEIYPKANVDSEAVFYLLNKNNNNYKKTFKKISGDVTLVWTDITKDKIYMVAHDNPLAMVKIKELDTIFWVSEIDVLKAIIEATIGSKNREFIELDSLQNENTVFIINSQLQVKKANVEFMAIQSYNDQSYDKRTNFTEDNYTYSQPKNPLDEKWSQQEKIWITTAIGNQICNACGNNVNIKSKLGFVFDTLSFQLFCNKCTIKNENLNDFTTVIYYKEYSDFINKNDII